MAIHPVPQAVSFDCYGTLIDWETGLERTLLFLLREKPDAPPPSRVLAAWERHERDLTAAKEYRRYRDVLAESLRLAFADLGVPWQEADGFRLVRDMGRWEPFDDVPGSLQELRHWGYRLAAFSNTDDDILAASAARMGDPFDAMVTAEQVKAYKPDERLFRAGLERLGLGPQDVLHVSFSPYHDLEPARRLGMRTFWVDRHGVGETEVPHDFQGRDLRALAKLLGP